MSTSIKDLIKLERRHKIRMNKLKVKRKFIYSIYMLKIISRPTWRVLCNELECEYDALVKLWQKLKFEFLGRCQ